jgi:hypothetical protein
VRRDVGNYGAWIRVIVPLVKRPATRGEATAAGQVPVVLPRRRWGVHDRAVGRMPPIVIPESTRPSSRARLGPARREATRSRREERERRDRDAPHSGDNPGGERSFGREREAPAAEPAANLFRARRGFQRLAGRGCGRARGGVEEADGGDDEGDDEGENEAVTTPSSSLGAFGAGGERPAARCGRRQRRRRRAGAVALERQP